MTTTNGASMDEATEIAALTAQLDRDTAACRAAEQAVEAALEAARPEVFRAFLAKLDPAVLRAGVRVADLRYCAECNVVVAGRCDCSP